MSRLFQDFVQRSFKYLFISLISFSVSALNDIDLTNYLEEIQIANTFEERKRGLMYKKKIPDNFGMFFEWDFVKTQCMWMKNTPVALNVAYIDSKGKIIDIYDMVPLSRASICSSAPVLYALEVNKGWFKVNDINIGDTINLERSLRNDN